MSVNLTLSEILVNLERRIESLRGQVELHARQEEPHREQPALREAELQKARAHLESFRAVAATAEELDLPAAAPAPPPEEEDLGPRPSVARRWRGSWRGSRTAPPGASTRSGPARRMTRPST